MRYIELNNNLPNQKFNIAVSNGTLEVELKTVDKITLMSVNFNGSNVVSSIKVAPNVLLIGYNHLQVTSILTTKTLITQTSCII